MAYTLTAKSATRVQNVGIKHSPKMFWGVVALSGGAATVTVPSIAKVLGAWVSPQSSNATTVSATSTNTFTIAGNGSDNVMWFALGE